MIRFFTFVRPKWFSDTRNRSKIFSTFIGNVSPNDMAEKPRNSKREIFKKNLRAKSQRGAEVASSYFLIRYREFYLLPNAI